VAIRTISTKTLIPNTTQAGTANRFLSSPPVTNGPPQAYEKREMLDANALMNDGADIGTDAFMDAIDPVLPAAYRLAYGLLSNRVEVGDVLQEATLSAWRHRRSLRAGAPMRPWFLAIVANQCRQTVRSRWWSVIRQPDLTVLDRNRGEKRVDDADALRQGLLQLSDRDRLVLVLRYYLDLSFDEVAATLCISATAARVRTHRALARLRPVIDIPEDLNDD
jgi:RNA polymerase sigma factor (sigma-70 family)